MNHHPIGAGVLVALAAVLTSTAALSEPPESCSAGDGLRGYNQGHELQEKLLRTSFERHFTCGTLESFIQAVRVDLEGGSSADLYLQCRDIGIVSGMDDTIRAIAEECRVQCTASGASIGRMEAKQYCGIQRVIRAARFAAGSMGGTPIPICDLTAEQACRAAFVSSVNSDPSCKEAAAQDPYYNEQIEKACKLRH